MDDHEYTRRIEVLRVVDTGRRRRWTDEGEWTEHGGRRR